MNITGYILRTGDDSGVIDQKLPINAGGCFYVNGTATNTYHGTSKDAGTVTSDFRFDASRNWFGSTSGASTLSNNIYGKSSTVQPPTIQMYLYFYSGN